ncbi:MAG TPA: endo-1,4-beta-xylanase [Polyangiaceae bacterium]|nr:endo-1,4-beta-xylanase [Polyangiaceae bacterium]
MKQLRWWIAALSSALLWSACIQREPVAKDASAPVATPSASGGAAEAPAKGNYGKVPGVDVLGGGGLEAFSLQGATARVSSSIVEVAGQPFSKAIRAEIKENSENLWDVQLTAQSKTEVRVGDVLLASFYFRTEYVPVESGEAETELNFELNHAPHDKSVTYSVRAGSHWKQVFVPFVAKRNFKAGEAQVGFRLGYPPQTVEFADIKVENFQKQLTLADLPKTKISYEGMEPDAPWRAKAEQRIDQLRKADLVVKVVGSDGKPVKGATVSAKLTRHAFHFGTAAPAETLLNGGNEKFVGLLRELFNTVTLENDLKWQALEDWSFPLERGVRGVDWLREAGMDVRGHVLVWPGWPNLPGYLQRFKDNPAQLREEVTAHIREVATAVKGKVIQWDVVNEPFTMHDLLDILGPEVMVDWFKQTHAIDPAPKLYINDFAILSGGGGTTPHRDHYEKMIQLLVDKGAPFDGIGLQGHFGSSLTSPDDLMAILDRYAKFKKDIAVTEFDVVIDDEETAGNFVRDFYTVLFSHPAVTTIMMWGFWDTNHWKKNAVMYRGDWSLKPGGQAYRDLVFGKWRTQEQGTTDAAGQFKLRGFKGNYDVEVKRGSDTRTVKATLADGGSRLDVKL